MTANKLLNELTRELNEISLPHMAEALNKVYHSGQYDQLDHLSLLQEIVEPEYAAKVGNRIENRLVKPT